MVRSSLLPATSQSRRATPKAAVVVKTKAGDSTSRSIRLHKAQYHPIDAWATRIYRTSSPGRGPGAARGAGSKHWSPSSRSAREVGQTAFESLLRRTKLDKRGVELPYLSRVAVAPVVPRKLPRPRRSQTEERERAEVGRKLVGWVNFKEASLVPPRSESCHFFGSVFMLR